MKTPFLALLALVAVPVIAAPSLRETAATHRFPVTLDEGLGGEGADRLLKDAAGADIFMFGENHGVREIALIADALYQAWGGDESPVLVTEIGPATAAEVRELASAGTLDAFLAQGVNLHALPFFAFKEDGRLLDRVLAASASTGSNLLWGLDQEFMAGAPLVLGRLQRLARTDAERDAVTDARRAAVLNPFLIGMGSGKALERLDEAFARNPEARKITAQLLDSHRIYKEQMGGDARWSNERRETLMMENFLDYAGDEPPARMFFKFGAFHLMQDRGLTVREPLGKRVNEWAEAQGMSTLNLFVECVGGEQRDGLFGRAVACESFLGPEAGMFAGLAIDGAPTLFDLRPLRGHPELGQASPYLQRMVNGYAWLLVIPDATAASWREGTLVTHRYGMIAAALALLLLFLLFLLVRGILRRRRGRRLS